MNAGLNNLLLLHEENASAAHLLAADTRLDKSGNFHVRLSYDFPLTICSPLKDYSGMTKVVKALMCFGIL
jgi:hypothetical protein